MAGVRADAGRARLDGLRPDHGFFNLPPELVAALVADDGGGLRWLGSHAGTKDYMHFELRDKPPLIVPGDSP
jgi:hypothetical protein